MDTNTPDPVAGPGASPRGEGLRGHVAVGVDGSPHAEPALRQAVREAQIHGTALEVVYARPWVAPARVERLLSHEEAREVAGTAAARARKLDPRLDVTAGAVEEDVTEVLMELSRRAAVTVVGSRGLGGFAGLLLGSVSLWAAAHVEGPLLVVRSETQPGGDRASRGAVLLGVAGQGDGDAIARAFEEAVARDAALTALHTWAYPHLVPQGTPLAPTSPLGEYAAQVARSETAAAEQAVAPFRDRYPRVHAQVRTVNGAAAHVLVEASAEADMVVVAAHRRHGRLGPRLGPVVHALLHHSHCPVLVVPIAGDAAEEGRP